MKKNLYNIINTIWQLPAILVGIENKIWNNNNNNKRENVIKNIWKELDLLDNKFLDLIKKRTNLVNQVLKNKKYKNEIIDNKRIKIKDLTFEIFSVIISNV